MNTASSMKDLQYGIFALLVSAVLSAGVLFNQYAWSYAIMFFPVLAAFLILLLKRPFLPLIVVLVSYMFRYQLEMGFLTSNIFMVAICLCAVLGRKIRIEYVPSKDFTFWFFAYYTYILISFYISQEVISYYEINGFLNSLILLALIALIFDSEKKIEFFYKTVVFCSAGLVFMGYAQLVQEGMPRNGMTGFYSNHVVYALHIAWGIPFSLYFFFKNRSKLYLFLFLILLSGALLAFSRGVILALICSGFAGTLLWRWSVIDKKERIKYVAFACLISAVLGSSLFFAPDIRNYFDPQEARQITSGRTILYEAAWDIFMENPIFGAGWEEFMDVWPQYAEITRPRYGTFMGDKRLDVHSSYLKVLAELGILGALVFFMFNFSLWRSTWRASLTRLGAPLLFVLLIYYFHGFVDNNSFGNDRMFYFAAGLLFSIQRNFVSPPPDRPTASDSS